ncbi:SDR family NAD(P)-dependent oxidoreductase [Paraburkholderia elongata]|uniref:SDR family NAD(P)-dependent oxidoreductase n=1 Tax=Paraburkholderia elongata TaxID=2675747 RepID=UPI001F229A39|nr:SDR family NAD(P)-dependent oxidoreductase [Paraburkholderia elongata]
MLARDADRAALEVAIAPVGDPRVVVHNAVSAAFGTFMEVEPEAFARNFATNTLALLNLAQLTTPAMVKAGDGALIVTCNTAALRGKANFAGFAPTKAAQRILAAISGPRACACRLSRH